MSRSNDRGTRGTPCTARRVLPLLWGSLLVVLSSCASHPSATSAGPAHGAGSGLGALDRELVREALQTWQVVEDRFLLDPRQELPWMMFVGESECFQLAPAVAPPGAVPRSLAGLEWRGRPLALYVEPHAGRLTLPSGDEVAVQPLALTSVAEDGTTPFFVVSLSEVWFGHPAFQEPQAREAFPSFWLGVVAHELVHTRQIAPVAARIEELRQQAPLPEDLDDDVIQSRFGANPDFASGIRLELETLHAASCAATDEESARLAREALGLAARRRTATFVGAEQVYGELEALFLALEGAACWVALQHEFRERISTGELHAVLAEYDPSGTAWVQGYGLLLYALVDRHVPDWRSRSFDRLPASPFELLQQALDPDESQSRAGRRLHPGARELEGAQDEQTLDRGLVGHRVSVVLRRQAAAGGGAGAFRAS